MQRESSNRTTTLFICSFSFLAISSWQKCNLRLLHYPIGRNKASDQNTGYSLSYLALICLFIAIKRWRCQSSYTLSFIYQFLHKYQIVHSSLIPLQLFQVIGSWRREKGFMLIFIFYRELFFFWVRLLLKLRKKFPQDAFERIMNSLVNKDKMKSLIIIESVDIYVQSNKHLSVIKDMKSKTYVFRLIVWYENYCFYSLFYSNCCF